MNTVEYSKGASRAQKRRNAVHKYTGTQGLYFTPSCRELQHLKEQRPHIFFGVVVLEAIVHGECHRMHQRQALPFVHLIMEEVAALVEPRVPLFQHTEALQTMSKAQRVGEWIPGSEGFLRQNMRLHKAHDPRPCAPHATWNDNHGN